MPHSSSSPPAPQAATTAVPPASAPGGHTETSRRYQKTPDRGGGGGGRRSATITTGGSRPVVVAGREVHHLRQPLHHVPPPWAARLNKQHRIEDPAACHHEQRGASTDSLAASGNSPRSASSCCDDDNGVSRAHETPKKSPAPSAETAARSSGRQTRRRKTASACLTSSRGDEAGSVLPLAAAAAGRVDTDTKDAVDAVVAIPHTSSCSDDQTTTVPGRQVAKTCFVDAAVQTDSDVVRGVAWRDLQEWASSCCSSRRGTRGDVEASAVVEDPLGTSSTAVEESAHPPAFFEAGCVIGPNDAAMLNWHSAASWELVERLSHELRDVHRRYREAKLAVLLRIPPDQPWPEEDSVDAYCHEQLITHHEQQHHQHQHHQDAHHSSTSQSGPPLGPPLSPTFVQSMNIAFPSPTRESASHVGFKKRFGLARRGEDGVPLVAAGDGGGQRTDGDVDRMPANLERDAHWIEATDPRQQGRRHPMCGPSYGDHLEVHDTRAGGEGEPNRTARRVRMDEAAAIRASPNGDTLLATAYDARPRARGSLRSGRGGPPPHDPSSSSPSSADFYAQLYDHTPRTA